MRRILIIAIVLAALPVFAGAPTTVVIEIDNMSCPVWARSIKEHLQQVPGVAKAVVSLRKKRATVAMKADANVDVDRLKKAISDAGFKPGAAVVQGVRRVHRENNFSQQSGDSEVP